MAITYERQWSRKFENSDGSPNIEAVQLWVVRLIENRITPTQLQYCLKQTVLTHPTFAPTLPEVLKMCREQQELNFPDFEFAFQQVAVVRIRYQHAGRYWEWANSLDIFVYNAFKEIDRFLFDRMPEKQARQTFLAAWERLKKAVNAGQTLEPVPKVIEQKSVPIAVPSSPEEAHQWVTKCLEILHSK